MGLVFKASGLDLALGQLVPLASPWPCIPALPSLDQHELSLQAFAQAVPYPGTPLSQLPLLHLGTSSVCISHPTPAGVPEGQFRGPILWVPTFIHFVIFKVILHGFPHLTNTDI